MTRVLPREEYGRLVGTELEAVAPLLPEGARVVVVEDQGAIVATWALFPMVHLEGCWVAEGYRNNVGVARQLLAGMVEQARDMGAQTVQTAAVTEEITRMALRLGAYELPGRHFSLRVGQFRGKMKREN